MMLESPYNAGEVAELARAHGEGVAEGVAAWIEAFAPEPEGAYAAAEPLIRGGHYGDMLGHAVRAYAARLTMDERLHLARREIHSSENQRLNSGFLEDVRFHEVDESSAADVVIEAYRQSGRNNERRRDLLDAWRVRNPVSSAVRQRLIDDVLLPAVKDGGKQALELIKARPHLWTNPGGRKRALKEAFRNAAGGKDVDPSLERLMRENGVVTTRGKGPLGLFGKEEMDED